MPRGAKVNGRINHDDTPEGRIAAVCKSLMLQMENRHNKTGVGPSVPDYADLRDVLKPFVERELLNARIDEARKNSGVILTARVKELAAQLQAIKFPDEFDL